MKNIYTSIHKDEELASKFLITCLVVTVVFLAIIIIIRSIAENYQIRDAFWKLFIYQDNIGAWLIIVLLLTAFAARGSAPASSVVGFFSRRPRTIAFFSFFMFCVGALLIYHDHPLSMDEYSARFQSEVFATGKLTGKYPVNLLDWLIPPEYQNYFLVVSHESGNVISSYLPGHALLLTPFTFLGIPWACNPAISAMSLLALHKLAQETFSNKEAGGWAILFALASPVFTINALSYYSMPAHLLLNLVFTILLLHPTPGKSFVAGLVGGLALVLHNPLPHALYALPWFIWLLYRRDFRSVGALVLGYLPPVIGLGIGWIVLTSELRSSASMVHDGNVAGSTAGSALQAWVNVVKETLTLQNMAVLLMRLGGSIKLWLWVFPGLPLLAFLGFWIHRENTIAKLLFASAMATFIGYFFIPFSQGHGWGYRYFHSAWGALPILAAAAVVRPQIGVQPSTHFVSVVGYLALSSLVLSTALRLQQVDAYIVQYLKQLPLIDTSQPTVTFVEKDSDYYTMNLVQNHPHLQRKQVIMLSQGAKANAKLILEIDQNAKQLRTGSWGEVWEADLKSQVQLR